MLQSSIRIAALVVLSSGIATTTADAQFRGPGGGGGAPRAAPMAAPRMAAPMAAPRMATPRMAPQVSAPRMAAPRMAPQISRQLARPSGGPSPSAIARSAPTQRTIGTQGQTIRNLAGQGGDRPN